MEDRQTYHLPVMCRWRKEEQMTIIDIIIGKVTNMNLKSNGFLHFISRMPEGFASLFMFGRARSKTSVENSIAVVGVKKALLIGNI